MVEFVSMEAEPAGAIAVGLDKSLATPQTQSVLCDSEIARRCV